MHRLLLKPTTLSATISLIILVITKKEYDESKIRNKTKKSNDETKEQEVSLSFAQIEGRCYCCGKQGHCLPTCRFKNKPKEEWAINKAQQNFLQSLGSTPTSTTTSVAPTAQTITIERTRTTSGWDGGRINFGFGHTNRMKDWILLDKQSSVTAFSNKRLVENIRQYQ
jgi:hypothetical protein